MKSIVTGQGSRVIPLYFHFWTCWNAAAITGWQLLQLREILFVEVTFSAKHGCWKTET